MDDSTAKIKRNMFYGCFSRPAKSEQALSSNKPLRKLLCSVIENLATSHNIEGFAAYDMSNKWRFINQALPKNFDIESDEYHAFHQIVENLNPKNGGETRPLYQMHTSVIQYLNVMHTCYIRMSSLQCSLECNWTYQTSVKACVSAGSIDASNERSVQTPMQRHVGGTIAFGNVSQTPLTNHVAGSNGPGTVNRPGN